MTIWTKQNCFQKKRQRPSFALQKNKNLLVLFFGEVKDLKDKVGFENYLEQVQETGLIKTGEENEYLMAYDPLQNLTFTTKFVGPSQGLDLT